MCDGNQDSSADHLVEFVHTHAALAAMTLNIAIWAIGLLIIWFGSAPMYRLVAFALPISAAFGAILFSQHGPRKRLPVLVAAVVSTVVILCGFIWITGWRPGIGMHGPGDGFEPSAVAVLTVGYVALFATIQFICAIANTCGGRR